MRLKQSCQWVLTSPKIAWYLLGLLTMINNLYAAEYQVGSRLPKSVAKLSNKPEKYRAIEWEDLLPKDWNLVNAFEKLNFDNLADDDPKAMQALENLKKSWSAAPIEPAMNGKRVKISGFMIPLERSDGKISEFLLAPYFGACIHSPPPPANQLIHVMVHTPFSEDAVTNDVTVTGVLHTQKMTSEMGQSGYLMDSDKVVSYREPKKGQIFLNMGGMVQRIPRSRD